MKFADSHCHLDFPELASQLPALLKQCQQAAINRIVIPTVDPDNWQRVLTLTSANQSHIELYPALGIHPWYLQGLSESTLDQLESLIAAHKDQIIAVGEAGIDGTIAQKQKNLEQQILFFERQLELANNYQLPIIIHHRKSHAEIVQSLNRFPVEYGGIVHAFSGSYQQAKAYLDRGFKLGIGGTISYQRAKKTINTVKKLPLDSMVLETDAPSMPLEGFQGQANSPLKLKTIFELLCQLREETPQDIADQLWLNLNDVLRIKNTQ